MNLDFITPLIADGAPPAESPMATASATAGATLEARDGWLVPASLTGGAGANAVSETVAFADVSSLPKTELQGPSDALTRASSQSFGQASFRDDAWWCPLTANRTLVIGERPDGASVAELSVLDVTSQFCGLRIEGPLARQLMGRFCALDLRPDVAPPGTLLPGSVARTPGLVIVEGPQRLLVFVGAALAEYFWTVVDDAARRVGGGPVGSDQLGGCKVQPTEVADA